MSGKLTLVTSKLLLPRDDMSLPPRVQWEITHYLRHGKDGWRPHEYLPEVAPLHAALVARQKLTAPPHVIAAWLRRLSNAATTNLTAEQLAGRIGEMVVVLGNRPAYCWTEETYVAAAERFKFFPSVAEVHEFHQQTIGRDRAMIYVTGELSSEETRLKMLERDREREEMERQRVERERERAEAEAEAEAEKRAYQENERLARDRQQRPVEWEEPFEED
jgi:hypothetical protein